MECLTFSVCKNPLVKNVSKQITHLTSKMMLKKHKIRVSVEEVGECVVKQRIKLGGY